jgi:hypothetical protein
MFDIQESDSIPDDTMFNPEDSGPGTVPLERVEAEICELAGHLTAATCRFLVLLGDFDARRGWASWEMTSCAAWLSWKCQMSSGTAREHVRVARALRELPVIRGEFGAGRLSYAKVRALTRIASPETEAGLAEIAGPMTGNQLERFARAHRQVSTVDDADSRIRRRLAWRFEEDGSLSGTFHLPPLAGAVLLKALRAAVSDSDHPQEEQEARLSVDTPAAARTDCPTSASLADGLLVIAEAFLADKIAEASDPEVYQVIVHVGTDAITPDGRPAGAGEGRDGGVARVSAETRAARPGDPADPARCHVEDGPAISVTTAQMIGCSASWSWMLHDSAGKLLDLGRRRRRPSAALRRAARERDTCRCRFPGCESRRVDLHHIRYWSNGGRPDGTAIPASPPLPEPGGTIGDCHDADINPDTIIPPWYGERLDLDYAIHVCFANAANQASASPPLPAGQAGQSDIAPPLPPATKWTIEPHDWMPSLRRSYKNS